MLQPPFLNLIPKVFAFVLLTALAFELADGLAENPQSDLDHRAILMLRDPQNPARMIGPPFVEESMRDFTGLGGYAVLLLTTVTFATFFRVELSREAFRFFVATTVSGYLLGVVLKNVVQRERPALVPHLSHVSGATSFPSSHAMMSVIVFVTIGLLLSTRTRDRHLQRLLTALPLGIAFVVGISRICMGVHYPTDVLAGWTLGLLWVWAAFRIYHRALKGTTTE
jgi:undecaprenyl-diphosphatase